MSRGRPGGGGSKVTGWRRLQGNGAGGVDLGMRLWPGQGFPPLPVEKSRDVAKAEPSFQPCRARTSQDGLGTCA